MRQLKFRVWNKATKSWLNDDAGTHLWSEYCINIFTGKIVEFITGDNKSFSRDNEPTFHFHNMNYVKESPYVVQQYTGLKDKNGVEIYEGDILLYKTNYNESLGGRVGNGVSVVSFEDGSFMIDEDIADKDLAVEHEVIGNIFENSEHLKA
jgi:uncharacterized phage protein (TIGR01671 family)